MHLRCFACIYIFSNKKEEKGRGSVGSGDVQLCPPQAARGAADEVWRARTFAAKTV